jgi:hypothetical protein
MLWNGQRFNQAMALWPGSAPGKDLSAQIRMRRGSMMIGTALALGIAALPGGISSVSVSAQDDCHYAYGGCLPYVDDLNCADIGDAVLEVCDVYDDPYRLDDAYGPGNGWTCDGIG